MQRLLITGLGFAIAALCAAPAFADDTYIEDPVVAPPYGTVYMDGSWMKEDQADSTGAAEFFSLAPDEINDDFQLACSYATIADEPVAFADRDSIDCLLDSQSSCDMVSNAQLDCLDCELAQSSPWSGEIRYRMQYADTGQRGGFSQQVRFGLRYREWVSDNVLLNFEIGTPDFNGQSDVIRDRHPGAADLELKKAYVVGHFD